MLSQSATNLIIKFLLDLTWDLRHFKQNKVAPMPKLPPEGVGEKLEKYQQTLNGQKIPLHNPGLFKDFYSLDLKTELINLGSHSLVYKCTELTSLET